MPALRLKNQVITSKKTKIIRLTIVTLIVVSMFVTRWLMLKYGLIEGATTPLSNEELQTRMQRTEGSVTGSVGAGYGTLLDIQAASKNKPDDTVYVVTASSLLKDENDTATIAFPDGTSGEAQQTGYNGEKGFAIVKSEVNGQDSVYYSSNVFYQLGEGSDVYFLSKEGELLHASLVTRTEEVDGFATPMLIATPDDADADFTALIGRGLYAQSGQYVGLIEAVREDGSLVAAPASEIVEYIKAHK